MNRTFKALYDEHKNILKVIGALLKECEKPAINYEFLERAIDFIKNYADKLHHAKEEDILFKELCKPGVLIHCNPTEQMLYEHDLGRGFVRGMSEGLKEKNRNKIIINVQSYAQLLQEHIAKEDDILYPMAEESLNEKIKQKILSEFKEVDTKKKEEKNKFEIFANRLK